MSYIDLPDDHKWESGDLDIYYHNNKAYIKYGKYDPGRCIAKCVLCKQSLFKWYGEDKWKVLGIKSKIIDCKTKQLEIKMHEALS